MAPPAPKARTAPSTATRRRTGALTGRRGPAVPVLVQVVPSASKRSGPDGRVATSTAAAVDGGADEATGRSPARPWIEAAALSSHAPAADGCSCRTPSTGGP